MRTLLSLNPEMPLIGSAAPAQLLLTCLKRFVRQNAAVYLVAMPPVPGAASSSYCDIQDDEHRCYELDVLEGNRQAVQSTVRRPRAV
jgi:hypothetical protein